MAQLCETLIAQDIAFGCDEMSVRGMEADGVIINREDVDFASCVISNS